ncbi:MAG: Dam family site-specific DNA-(adenine-N6)-methyltransferase [Bacteroidales bacterium]|jgi:DNA adenine methylase|nr:Dam family site-specific DNA-(adenine-N6)-methyltransferase [Bacteroidales bacterium]
MKPLVKYRGGKSNEISNISKHIPEYKGRYIEPFFGGGALYFHIEPKRAIINDINSKLIAFYTGIKSNYPTLRTELDEIEKIYEANRKQFDELKRQTPNERVEDKNEELYYQLRDMFNDLADKKYSDALLYFFINKTAYSGMIRYNSKGEFNVPFGRYTHLNTALVTKKHSDLLATADIYNTGYKDIFDMAQPYDFIFLDPPYDCIFSDYGNEEYKNGFDDDCHITLAKDIKNLNCKVLLVIGRTALTEKLYGDMIIDEYAKNYSVNIRNRFKSVATHILVANYQTNYQTLFSEQFGYATTYQYGKNRQ